MSSPLISLSMSALGRRAVEDQSRSPPFSAIDPTRINAAYHFRHRALDATDRMPISVRPGRWLGEVDPKVPKSISKRQDELHRVLQYPATSQRAFQKLNFGYQFPVSSSMVGVVCGRLPGANRQAFAAACKFVDRCGLCGFFFGFRKLDCLGRHGKNNRPCL